MEGVMVKSLREGQLRSSWGSPDIAYEEAMLGFVRDALEISRPNAFLSAFLQFQERIARLGSHNSIVQTALKLTLPGVPDIYQGAELWDLSLVDPDNRRSVDYRTRIGLLEQVLGLAKRDRQTTMPKMLEDWQDGRAKLAVIATLLGHRRDHPNMFVRGSYEPLVATGAKADQICAFARCYQEDVLVVAVTRFPFRSEADFDWTGTQIPWPQAAAAQTHWRELFGGRVLARRGEHVTAEELLGNMPIAALVPDNVGYREL
jgi:(1->4)-alpha-D-glucan 1-alpha-D-glucosylmutase